MSVNDNLTVLHNELEEIREALHNKGVEVGCDMTGYAEAIDAIDTNMLKSASAEAFDASKSPVQTFSIRSTSNGPSATADYDPETKHIHFTFGLVPGPAGRDGVPGVDGAPGERGEQGAAGKDGSRFEYIYRATNTPFEVTDFPELKEIVDRDHYVPTGWSADPQGVTEGLEWEYTSHREKEDGHWGAWSTPVVWSHFGTTGKDGNGIEYIFCSTKDTSIIPPVPYSDPNSEENPGMFPLKTWKDGVEYLWWDDPQETNETWTICWSSLRRQSYENDVQKWGAYTNPVVWSRYAKDGKEGGGRTVQIYTRDDDPNANVATPTGGSWDPETNNVDLTETGNFATTDGRKWSTNPNDLKGLHIWQSNCTFNSAGTAITNWCEPFRITGDNGEAGADGTSVEFIYRLLADKNDYNSLLDFHTNSGLKLEITDTDTAPSKIDNFVESNIPDGTNLENWQFVDGMYTICETDWTDQPQGIDGDKYLLEVVCSRKFNKEIGEWGEWTIPTIWSMWGEDGMDGDGVEYIYCITPKKDEDGEIMAGHPLLIIPSREVYELNGKGEEYQKPDFVPGRDFTLIGENGWTDEPQDVSPEQPVEWVSVRKKRKWKEDDKEATWGDFSTPKKWAMWSTDGNSFKTGYAFAVSYLPLDQLITNPSVISGGSYERPIPNETIISVNGQRHVITWFDTVPSGGDQKSLWMVNRTFMSGEANPDSEDSTDQYWTLPCRMSDRTDFQVEYSKGFTTDEGKTFDENQRPYPNSFQKYFLEAPEGTNPEDKHNVAEQNWREAERAKGFIWDDYVEGAVWMLTSTFKNGEWSAWSVIRVKGEKGDDGTSVDIKGHAMLWDKGKEGDCALPKEQQFFNPGSLDEEPVKYLMFWDCDIRRYKLHVWNETLSSYDDVDESTLINGDGYLVGENLWVWDGDSWENVGKIKGDPGEKTYLYIAYSNNPDVLSIGNDGVDNFKLERDEDGNLLKVGKYCGYFPSFVAYDDEYLSWANVYTWSKWIGDDGWGWEQIFLLTNGSDFSWDKGPNIESLESKAEKGFRPEHGLGNKAKGSDDDVTRWSDGPLTPTAEYPYCWVCIREASTTGYGDWKNLSLYTQYASSADHLELSEDQITVPVEANEQPDTEWTGVDLTALLYSGSSIIDQENVKYEYSINGEEWNSNEGNIFTFNRDFFVKNAGIQKIYFKVMFNTFEFKKVCHVFWSKVGYELNVSKTIVRKNLYDGGYPEDDVIEVRLRKWDFTNNVWKTVDDCNVWAQYYYVDPDDQAEYGKDPERAVTKTGTATFDISDKINLEKIKFYATIDGNSDSEIIAFEEVGVIANGLDGNSIEYIYFLTDDENSFDVASDYFTPEAWWKDLTYQDPDYIPTSQGWTDVPSGVSEEKPYEFVSVRKHEQTPNGMEWSEFTHPILWAKYGRDAGTCAFSTGTAIVSFVNKELSIDRVVDTINLKKASDSVEITSVSAKTMYIDNVEVENANDWPIKVNWTGEYCGFIFNETNLPQSDTSYKPCVIDVDVEVQSTIGTFVIRKTIILQQGGGESAFRVQLGNEYIISLIDRGEAKDVLSGLQQYVYVFYGTTALDQTNITSVKVFYNNVEVSSSFDGKKITFIPSEDLLKTLMSNIEEELTFNVKITVNVGDKEYTLDAHFIIAKTTIARAEIRTSAQIVNLKDQKEFKIFVHDLKSNVFHNTQTSWKTNGYEVIDQDGNECSENYHLSKSGLITLTLKHNGEFNDEETVSVIDITNPYLLDLSPDHEYIDTDGSGKILDESAWPTIKCTLWNGSDDVTSDTTFEVIPNDNNLGVWESTGVYKLKGMSGDTMELTFTGKYNGVTVSKVFKAVKSFGKVYYKIDVPTAINADKINTFDIAIQKIDNGNVTNILDIGSENLTLYVSGGKTNQLTRYTVSSGTHSIPVKLYKGAELMDSETIAIVYNGMLDETEAAKLKAAAVSEAKTNLDTAITTLRGNYTGTLQQLSTAISTGDSANATSLSAAANRITNTENAIKTLNGYFDTEGKLKEDKSPWTVSDIYDFSIAALGADAEVGANDIARNSVFAQNVISCVGKFIDLKADSFASTNITGMLNEESGTVIGLNVYSDKTYDTSKWAFNSDGSGKVANGQISWDNSGKVIFGENVSINWENINDVDNKVKTVIGSDYITTNVMTVEAAKVTGALTAATISANDITAGTIDASKITVTNLDADNISTGTLSVEYLDIDAITTGVISSDLFKVSAIMSSDNGKAFNLFGNTFTFGNGILTGNSSSITLAGFTVDANNFKASDGTDGMVLNNSYIRFGQQSSLGSTFNETVKISGTNGINLNYRGNKLFNIDSSSSYGTAVPFVISAKTYSTNISMAIAGNINANGGVQTDSINGHDISTLDFGNIIVWGGVKTTEDDRSNLSSFIGSPSSYKNQLYVIVNTSGRKKKIGNQDIGASGIHVVYSNGTRWIS